MSHSEAIHVETREPITPERARELFAAVPGVVVQDDPATHEYPLATEAAGRDEIFVGRVRQDASIADGRGLAFWVVSDNLRKGAATNAVETRRDPRRRGWVAHASARGAGPTERAGARWRPAGERRDRRRAPGGARGDRGRGPRLHPLPPARSAHAGRPGRGQPVTEVVFVGEGPGFNEDKQGRPFVGRAGRPARKLIGSIGWRREDVFITNIVKCRPPENRDPEPDEIAACAPFLPRQLEVLDPALVVTLGRFSMAVFMPGARICQAHGTVRPVDPATGAEDALVLAMYHPAAAFRTPAIEREQLHRHGDGPGRATRRAGEARRARRASCGRT